MCAEETQSMGLECCGTGLQCCSISVITNLLSSLAWGGCTEHRFLVTLSFSSSACFTWCFVNVYIDSSYLQARLTCFFFFTEEERQLQANNRDFNLQFEYAVSNQHMLSHADVVTDAAASASCLACCFKGVTWLDAAMTLQTRQGCARWATRDGSLLSQPQAALPLESTLQMGSGRRPNAGRVNAVNAHTSRELWVKAFAGSGFKAFQ